MRNSFLLLCVQRRVHQLLQHHRVRLAAGKPHCHAHQRVFQRQLALAVARDHLRVRVDGFADVLCQHRFIADLHQSHAGDVFLRVFGRVPERVYTFLLHYGVYLWLVALGTAIIWGLSFLMQHWLEWVITRPVEALQKRIETVGSGNFAPDRTVEWNNELGDIGRGINQLAENVDSLMTRRVEDERRKQELEYRMLQNEVNPHFIYNTLNSIRWMATIQHAPGIAEMVTAFARLTKSISKGTQKLVPLQEELALLNDYFTIQQYRYGGDLEIEVSRIESETLCRDCMIPRFTLQPLVENAIFHGLEPKGGHGSVLLDISTDPDTGDVLLRITDDGVGMPPEQVAHLLDEPAEGAEKAEKFRHVGLWNVNRRIRYSFGEGYGLTIESEEDVGTEVTIRLPYQQKGDTHAADITGG